MRSVSFVLILLLTLVSCSPRPKERVSLPPPAPPVEDALHGFASFYGDGFHGKKTANGEIFNASKMTAAHRTLPFNTRVKVRNIHNGKEVVVRINDRGPYAKNRVIDLSEGAARVLGITKRGVARVELTVLSQEEGHKKKRKPHPPKKDTASVQ